MTSKKISGVKGEWDIFGHGRGSPVHSWTEECEWGSSLIESKVEIMLTGKDPFWDWLPAANWSIPVFIFTYLLFLVVQMGSVGSGTGSGGSSGGSGEEMRPLQMTSGVGATICEGEPPANSDIDPSSSEQSCDTVIYLGPSLDDGTDGENPPIYLPPLDGDT